MDNQHSKEYDAEKDYTDEEREQIQKDWGGGKFVHLFSVSMLMQGDVPEGLTDYHGDDVHGDGMYVNHVAHGKCRHFRELEKMRPARIGRMLGGQSALYYNSRGLLGKIDPNDCKEIWCIPLDVNVIKGKYHTILEVRGRYEIRSDPESALQMSLKMREMGIGGIGLGNTGNTSNKGNIGEGNIRWN